MSITADLPMTFPHATPVGSGATDPVCKMTVDAATAKWKLNHQGQPVFFCSEKCLQKFVAEPALSSAGPAL